MSIKNQIERKQKITVDYSNILVSHKSQGFPKAMQKAKENILSPKPGFLKQKSSNLRMVMASQIVSTHHTSYNL